jgi:hypothetical protein
MQEQLPSEARGEAAPIPDYGLAAFIRATYGSGMCHRGNL